MMTQKTRPTSRRACRLATAQWVVAQSHPIKKPLRLWEWDIKR
jgi:hypothetical protein